MFGVVTLHVALSAYALTAEPIWIDEGATWLFAQRTHAQLWTIDLWSETNPPAYYSVMRVWVGVFGDSLAAMRSLSLVASAIALVGIYAILWRLTRRAWSSTLGALGVASSPMVVYYSQEARAFTLAMLAATLALWGLVVLLTHPAAASRPLLRQADGRSNPRAIRLAWLAYCVGAAAALYCHFSMVFLMAGCTATLALAWVIGKRSSGRMWVNWVIVNACAVVLAAPVFVAFVYHSLNSLEGFWIPEPSVGDGLIILAKTYVSRLPKVNGGFYVLAVLLLIAAIALPRLRGSRRLSVGWAVGVGLAVVMPALMWVVSQYQPIMIPRALIWSVPALVIGLVAAGQAALHRSVLNVVLALLATVGVVEVAQQNAVITKQDYGSLIELAVTQGGPDTVYYSSSSVTSWAMSYLFTHEYPDAPAWTYLTDRPPRISITADATFYDDALPVLVGQDDIMMTVREGAGLDDFLKPALQETHSFERLATAAEHNDSVVLYRIRRKRVAEADADAD